MTATWEGDVVGFLFYLFSVVQFLVTVGLIAIVALQTSKSEGLSGTLGGSTSVSGFHSRPGMEEQLQQWTTYLAIGFLILSFITSLFHLRFNI